MEAEKKSLISKVPGFRSNKLWKKILASFFYFILFLIIIAMLTPSEVEKKGLTLEEIKSQAIEVSYDDLFRNNEDYAGKIIHIDEAKVLQIMEGQNDYDLRVDTTRGDYTWEDTIYVRGYTGSRLMEGDIIEIYGEVVDLYSYTAVLGNTITIPRIKALNVQQTDNTISTNNELNEGTNGTTENNVFSEEFIGDISDLIITREEINTEYKLEENKELDISGFFPKYQEEGLETTGFNTGMESVWYILEGTNYTDAYIHILEFDDSGNATKFYNKLISMTKNEGGYKEKSTSGIDAQCFAVEGGNSADAYYTDYYCQKKNIFFSTEIVTWNKSRFSEAESLAKKIAKKI